jgi:hypothetical protein
MRDLVIMELFQMKIQIVLVHLLVTEFQKLSQWY